jgi:hypothetical protein
VVPWQLSAPSRAIRISCGTMCAHINTWTRRPYARYACYHRRAGSAWYPRPARLSAWTSVRFAIMTCKRAQQKVYFVVMNCLRCISFEEDSSNIALVNWDHVVRYTSGPSMHQMKMKRQASTHAPRPTEATVSALSYISKADTLITVIHRP